MANFFTLQKDTEGGVTLPGASNPVGLIGDVYSADPVNNGIVSVISNMRFTGSDLTTYQKSRIPFCLLNEYELITNSAVSSLLYTLQGVTGGTGAARTGGNVVNKVKTLLKPSGIPTDSNTQGGSNFFNFAAFVGEGVADSIGSVVNSIRNTGQTISDFTTQLAAALESGLNAVEEVLKTSREQTGSIKPYQNLYVTKPTGFHYTFPYYSNNKKDITSNFSVTEAGLLNNPIVNTGSKFITSGIEKFAQVALFTAPGVYIERPKFYNLADSGPAYDIKFSLINTFDVRDIQRHYDFLFLLTFQNLPYRKDLARVKLPRIYSFILPGELFLPYAYISKMTIEFEGNRRLVRLNHPLGKVVESIVPDVYNVSITVTSLNPDAGNFMVADKLLNIKSFYAEDGPIAQPGTVLPAQVGSVIPNSLA